jgi:hypothetical protein
MGRMPMVAGTMAAVAATVTARSGHQKDFDAFGSVLRERASHAQGFVIGVGENRHQPQSVHEAHLQMNIRNFSMPRVEGGSRTASSVHCRVQLPGRIVRLALAPFFDTARQRTSLAPLPNHRRDKRVQSLYLSLRNVDESGRGKSEVGERDPRAFLA